MSYSWIGASGDWDTPTNWSGSVVPGAAATATIANAGSNTVTIASSESIGVTGVTLSNGNTLLVDGSFAADGAIGVTGASLSTASAGQFIDNGTLTDAGTIIGGITVGQAAAPLSIAGGAILGNRFAVLGPNNGIDRAARRSRSLARRPGVEGRSRSLPRVPGIDAAAVPLPGHVPSHRMQPFACCQPDQPVFTAQPQPRFGG